MRYRYEVLGGTRVLDEDGAAVPLGGTRLRTLVTALALAGGRTVSTGALVAKVWADGDPPADAVGALQALVGRLRRTLGRDAVVSQEGGYRLAADRDDVDVFRFERLVAEGTRALDAGDAAGAVGPLDEALALWRDDPRTDLPDAAETARIERLRLAAVRARTEARAALEGPREVLAELAELCARHPLDEPLQALRLRALRDAGRTAEALAAYEEVRRELAERLGADPGAELRALHAELLRRPAPREARGNLRARLTSFVGREAELAAVREGLAAHRLLTLVGPGGSGKTRLAQEAADGVARRWPDGAWLAELAPVGEAATVAETVLTVLGGRETVIRGAGGDTARSAADASARLAELCAHRELLLVLDNCEHVVGAAAELVETLLTRCPGVTVLATSREPLGVPGEVVRSVEPLPVPVALRLLEERGAAVRPGFSTARDLRACEEICRRLDGLPLAVELAAARLRALSPRQIADRLDDRFRLLTGGSRTVLPRQQTLRAVVDWSWELLEEPERAVLRRLSVFAGGCELEEAEAVCGGDGIPADEVAVLLASLVDRSLVVAETADTANTADTADPAGGTGTGTEKRGDGADGEGGRMRYRLLETVGEYAAERLAEAGEREAVERRHLVAYRELARTTDPLLRGPEQRRHLDRLEREHDNLRAALRRAVSAGEEQEALCLVLSLSWFWDLRGHRTDARTWSGAVAELGPDPFEPPVAPAPPLVARCTDTPPPMPPEQLVEARRQVWLIHLTSGEPDMEQLETPRTWARLRGLADAYRPGLPQVCRPPGMSWFYALVLLGEQELIDEVFDAAVETCRRLGRQWELACALQLRAKILIGWSDSVARVVRDTDESLEIFSRLGDAWGVAEALSGRGEARERHGDLAGAVEDYRRAIGVAEELGAHTQVVVLRTRLGSALLESGGVGALPGEDGERMLREVVADADRTAGDAAHFARIQLVFHLGVTGRTAAAREHLAELEDRFRGGAPDIFLGMVRGLRGWLDVLDGRYEEAIEVLRESLRRTQDGLAWFVAPRLAVSQLPYAAHALSAVGRAADAARLLGAYDGTDRPYGPGEATVRESRARAEAAARAALGDEAYERAHAEGGGLSLREAAALV
ncbi:AfsR family transcriptional regulator [Streptomyces sp. TRM43335]|uniref:AfsR family transcriptional regulator n=1 Tax=Streptomyces taklimakanensis TaxID=2569853 RepID=A0A6G2B944_9ACTN|nr:BTAD domain-containing putative transcriptional regulator [Streptomyces taklimakanensis]MTE18780.1 AfsR family transcriptional regulator [Streptomyces taklimakanensis]